MCTTSIDTQLLFYAFACCDGITNTWYFNMFSPSKWKKKFNYSKLKVSPSDSPYVQEVSYTFFSVLCAESFHHRQAYAMLLELQLVSRADGAFASIQGKQTRWAASSTLQFLMRVASYNIRREEGERRGSKKEEKKSCQWRTQTRENVCCELYPIALDWTHVAKKSMHTRCAHSTHKSKTLPSTASSSTTAIKLRSKQHNCASMRMPFMNNLSCNYNSLVHSRCLV